MKVLILSFSSNQVNEDSFIPNKIGLTFSCVEECEKQLKTLKYEYEHICIQKDDFNEIYKYLENFDAYVFITPVYFNEMSESAKTFFDRLKRCDAFNDNSKIKGKKIVCIACAGGSGSGTEETLKSFDTLNYFLETEMYSRIPVTKANFENQKVIISDAMKMEGN